MLRYRVKLSHDTNGTILVDVPDVPEAHTFGEDREEALLRAPDAIETAFMCYIDLRRDIPMPRATGSKGPFVTLPALTEAKLALYTAMRTANMSKAELARRLDGHMPQVDRLLDLRHASRLDQMEAAFRALGKQLSVDVRDAA
jgi:antitoxin HicB